MRRRLFECWRVEQRPSRCWLLQVSSAQLSWQMAVLADGIGRCRLGGLTSCCDSGRWPACLACQSWETRRAGPTAWGPPITALSPGRVVERGIVFRLVASSLVQSECEEPSWVFAGSARRLPGLGSSREFSPAPARRRGRCLACMLARCLSWMPAMEWNAVLPTLYRSRTLPLLHMYAYVCTIFISLTLT